MQTKIVFTTLHDAGYQSLADITLEKNKRPYCEMHGYPLVVKSDDWHEGLAMGYEKAYLFKDAFNVHPEAEWLFFSECDTLITNMNVRLESIVEGIDPKIHLLITTDANGINAGNMFLRNSAESYRYLDEMLRCVPNYPHEQAFIQESYHGYGRLSKRYRQMIQLMPQNLFNSYEYRTIKWTKRGFSHEMSHDKFSADDLGNRGQWEKGDFLIHWPNTSLDLRLNLAKFYSQYILSGEKRISVTEKLVTSKKADIVIYSESLNVVNHIERPSSFFKIIQRQINTEGIYDRFFDGKDGLTILDFGGNIGMFSLHVHDRAQAVYAIEPTPAHFAILSELTKPYENIKPMQYALGGKDEEVSFYICDENTTMNSLVNNYGKQIKVQAITVKSLVDKLGLSVVDFVKCDIEGSEMVAITVDTVEPVKDIVKSWFLEVHRTERGTHEENRNVLKGVFEACGYTVEIIGFDTLYAYKV
jgi:FkbM family methyltransferase